MLSDPLFLFSVQFGVHTYQTPRLIVMQNFQYMSFAGHRLNLSRAMATTLARSV